jgi:phage host-nuclease inhibitor protein Gam
MINELEIAASAPEDETDQGWRIASDLEADWAVKKIKAARKDLERKKQLAEAEIQEIQDWIKSEQEKTEKSTAFFEAKLKEYFNSLDKDVLKETKTQLKYELRSGVLKLKKQGPDIKRDNNVLVQWLLDAGLDNYIKIKKEPDWAALKDKLELVGDKAIHKETGEIVPGICVEPQPDKFIIE